MSWTGRVAFVGQSTYFEACSLPDGAAPGVATTFVEYRKDGDAQRMLEQVRAFAPDVIVVFRPEVVPHGLLAGERALTLGFLTEPLPRERDGAARHEDLGRRLWELEQVDPTGFDRVVAFDPHIATTASAVLPVWRSLPLPVSDRYYRDPATIDPRVRPQALFVGRSTEHREWLLTPAKHTQEVLHLAFGVDAAMLEDLMDQHDVALNLHNQSYLSFENRVCLHLAAGHLVLSEPLHPLHGLEPGVDFVPFITPSQLTDLLATLRDGPATFHAVRMRGRRKAESYRASRVWPRLLGDLVADLRAFGTRAARGGGARMKLLETRLDGPKLFAPTVFGDDRGFFAETFRAGVLAEHGILEAFVQDNHSRSDRGVVRGLHFQIGAGVSKLVRCGRGEILDVLVDLRRDSPTYRQWEGFVLSDENMHVLYAPVGFGHGFVVRSAVADVLYKQSGYYATDVERGIKFDDPDVAVDWGLPEQELTYSQRDKDAPSLAAFEEQLHFPYRPTR